MNQKLRNMKTISKANNVNNSRVTVEYAENGVLSRAYNIAVKHGCGFSHNVTSPPATDQVPMPTSFGTISFNKGNHLSALQEFLKIIL